MGWVKIREITAPSKSEIAILGFPGMANVGEQVLTYLIKEKEPVPVAKIYSEHLMFPNNMVGISVLEDGKFVIPSVSVFNLEREKIALVTSDVQPLPWGGMEVASEIMKFLMKMSIKKIVVVTGFVDESLARKALVFGNDEELLRRFLKAGAIRQDVIKSVIGLAGSVLAISKIRGLNGVVVSGVAPDYSPDPKAAKTVLEVLNKTFSLGIDFEIIDRQIEEIERIKSELIKEIEKKIREEMRGRGGVDESTEYVG